MMLRRALATGLSAAVATAGVAALAVTAGPVGGLRGAPGDLALAAATGCASGTAPTLWLKSQSISAPAACAFSVIAFMSCTRPVR